VNQEPTDCCCEIRDERPDDAAAVEQVHERAFGRPDEAAMVQAVRAQGAATVSLIAALGPETVPRAEREIVGHILLSPVTLEGQCEPRGLGLAPLAVLPEHQRNGIGSELVEAALQRARSLGHAYVVVLGHPRYYPRFGFVPASRFGLRYEQPVPDPAFMALELAPGCLAAGTGVVRYLSAFSSSGGDRG
jgi:putative acetyltransferase